IGTLPYMSPELLAETIGYEETSLLKCDVYALGIVFWKKENTKKIVDIYVNNYIYPFEEQLKELNLNVNNPTVNEMNIIIYLKEPKNRPLINSKWKNTQKSFQLIVII
ncbi:unnamed protein product, partial [Rotaria sp. Silwood2]